jgi:hypothetical protein
MRNRRLVTVLSAAAITTAAGLSMLVVPNGVSAAVVPDKPSDLVTLEPEGFCPMGGFDMTLRVLPNATDVPFSIPQGRVLVITDWQWGNSPTGRSNSWENAALSLQTANPPRAITVGVAGNSTPGAQGTAPFDQETSNNASIVGMVVVKPGVHICVEAETRGAPQSAVVHGFLATDE